MPSSRNGRRLSINARVACLAVTVSLVVTASLTGQISSGQTERDPCTVRGVSPRVFRKVINKQFSALLNPQGQAGVGSFAAVDLKQAKVAFTAASIFRNGSVLAIRASGASTSGLLPVLDGAKLTSELALGFEYNFLSNKRRYLTYELASCREYYSALRRLELDFREKVIADSLSKALLRLDTVRLGEAKAKLERDAAAANGDKRDSILIDVAKSHAQLGKAIEALARNSASRTTVEDWRAAEAEKLDSLLQVTGFRIAWFSLGYDAANSDFRLFDPSRPFADQVREESFLSHTIHVRYSTFNLSAAPYETYYWSLALSGALGNNLDDLEPLELVEHTPFGPAPTDRVGERRIRAFRGDYRSRISSATLSGDFYWFLFDRNQAAFHLYPQYRLVESQRSRVNVGAGFLLAFKGKDSPKSNVLAELYVLFRDLGNAASAGSRVIDRAQVGLRFAFPVNLPSSGGN